MPFMLGQAPIRRTLQYLNKGEIVFRDFVRIFTVNYTFRKCPEHHLGTKEFVFWHLPQIQYKNPKVQCITYKELTPSPFVRIFLDNGESVIIDTDSRDRDDIYDHLKNFTAICKSKEQLEYELQQEQKLDNPANFGHYCERHCICEVFNQAPCSGLIPMPYYRRGLFPAKPVVRVPDFIKLEALSQRKETKKVKEAKEQE